MPIPFPLCPAPKPTQTELRVDMQNHIAELLTSLTQRSAKCITFRQLLNITTEPTYLEPVGSF